MNNNIKRAFGLVLYEMIYLKRLFDGKDILIVGNKIREYKNENLDLSQIQNQMFQKILKKYLEYVFIILFYI